MRHGVSGDFAAYAVEAEVGDVMLSTAIKAAADLDVEVLDGLVGGETLLADSLAQFGCEPTRRRNSEFAGISSGAAGDID